MTHERGEARALDRAAADLLRGEPPPAARPRDLDALTGLLVAHRGTLREAVPPPPPVMLAPRQSPRVLAATVAVAAALLVGIALRGGGVPVAPAPLAPAPMPLAPAAVMPMAMAPVSVRMMGFPSGDAHAPYATLPPTLTATVPPPVAETARTYRVVAPGGADVAVQAAPDANAPAVTTVFDGMAIEVVGERVTGAVGESWYPVRVGAVRGFLRTALLQPTA